MRETVQQCATCPWKVSVDPTTDIPHGYSVDLHRRLTSTIAQPGSCEPTHMMACHYSKPGTEYVCAGWLHQQLGPGNNIWARLLVARGELPVPHVEGAQHQRFEDTLPEGTGPEY